jgi:hypothetical protein
MADKLAQYDLLSSIMIVWHPVYDVSVETLSSMDLNEKPGFFFSPYTGVAQSLRSSSFSRDVRCSS